MARRPTPIVLQGRQEDSLGSGLAGLGKLFEGIAGIKTTMQAKEQRENLIQQAVTAGMNEDVARGRESDALAKYLIGEGEKERKLERTTDFLASLLPKKKVTTTTPVTPSERGEEVTPDIKITDLAKPIGPIAAPITTDTQVTEEPTVGREQIRSAVGLVQEGLLPPSELTKIKGFEDILGEPEPEKAFKIGARIEEKSGDQIITKEVIGFNEDGSPITKTIATAPRSLAGAELTAEQKNIGSLQESMSTNLGRDISYQEASREWKTMKSKSQEQYLLDIYSNQISAGANDEEARGFMDQGRKVWDEVFQKDASALPNPAAYEDNTVIRINNQVWGLVNGEWRELPATGEGQ